MNDLESIIEKGVFRKDLSFAIDPKDTIKQVLNSNQKSKEKTLTLLDKHYHHRIL